MKCPFSDLDLSNLVRNSSLLAEMREPHEFETRQLRLKEISRLAVQGNTAEAWERVRVIADFQTEGVIGCRFEGNVTLGRFVPGEHAAGGLPSGVYFSTLSNSTVASGARVSRCGLLSRYDVRERASIEGAARIVLQGDRSDFGNSLEILKEELYSRALMAVAELPFEWAAWMTSPEAAGEDAHKHTEAYLRATAEYVAAIGSPRGHIGSDARINGVGVIEDCWIGRGVAIDGAASLRNSTFWSAPGEPTSILDGAIVRGSLVGPGCTVETGALLERSIFFEHVHASTQAIVKGCAVGPNSRLGELEALDCFLGPFTSANHHALIISAWWPEGRGNLSYGANVGSNHTGRAPDQEIFPGEGAFFGLGCSIKFPSNFREAPYTMIATGVNSLPQRVSFPFSLIMEPERSLPGISPAINEIRPGWALRHNAYGIERRERNFSARNKAKRTPLDLTIFRPAMLEAIERALEHLRSGKIAGIEFYTDKEISGIGKNFMTERSRAEAIDAYQKALRMGAARCLLREVSRDAVSVNGSEGHGVSHEIFALAVRHLRTNDPVRLIDAALDAEAEWLTLVRDSKVKDLRRGNAILDDYRLRHASGAKDQLIKLIGAEFDGHTTQAQKYVELLRPLVPASKDPARK